MRGSTLGILGYGRIGGVLARYGKAFEMNVLAWGRDRSAERARADGVEFAASKEALFERSDVLTLHVRLTPETRGLVTAADLARMKPARADRQHQPRRTDRAGRARCRAEERGGPAWPRWTCTRRSRC